MDMVLQVGDKKSGKSGALAREGISCMICHQMSPESVRENVHSGDFQRGPWNKIFGPTADDDSGGAIRTWPMEPVQQDGTVLMSRAHEQDAYSEWLYSAYAENNPDPSARKGPFSSCQDCHLRSTYENGPTLNMKVANVQDTSWPISASNNLAETTDITVPPDPSRRNRDHPS